MRTWKDAHRRENNPIDPGEWQTHFQDLLNENSEISLDFQQEIENAESIPYFSELDYQISAEEIMCAGKRLNKTASPGPDKISGKVIFDGLKEFIPLIKLLFNKVFAHASILTPWKMNFLVTIFKKGDSSDPNNYRGIAIGSSVCKLFSLILLDRLEKRVILEKPITPNQSSCSFNEII